MLDNYLINIFLKKKTLINAQYLIWEKIKVCYFVAKRATVNS